MNQTDVQKLQSILSWQSVDGIKSQDWKDVREFDITPDEGGGVTLRIPNVEIGFVFNEKHNLIGIYNWKE